MGNMMEELQMVFIDSDEVDTRIWSPSANDILSSNSFFLILISDTSLPPLVPVSNI